MKRSNSLAALLDKVVNIPVLQIIILIIVFTLISMFSLSAQTPHKDSGAEGLLIKPLQIGDIVPQKIWEAPLSVANHPFGKKVIKLDEFRGKIIILDFLSTGCASCIEALPKLRQIQNDNMDDLVILPITSERLERVISMFSLNEYAKKGNFATVYDDHLLKLYFPHLYISHLVWIDKQGYIKAITYSNMATAFNIAKFKKGNVGDWPVKVEGTAYFDSPLIKFNYLSKDLPHNDNTLKHFVWISGFIEGLGQIKDPGEGLPAGYRWLSFRNYWPLDLIRLCLPDGKANDIIEFSGLDSSRFHVGYSKSTALAMFQWEQKNAICYERPILITEKAAEWKKSILDDLCDYLNIKVHLYQKDNRQHVLIANREFNHK